MMVVHKTERDGLLLYCRIGVWNLGRRCNAKDKEFNKSVYGEMDITKTPLLPQDAVAVFSLSKNNMHDNCSLSSFTLCQLHSPTDSSLHLHHFPPFFL